MGDAIQNQSDGRMHVGAPLYCEGAHKPTCRGWFHLASALATPFLMRSTESWDMKAFKASALLCYMCSAAYHMVHWPTHAMEIFAQKLDHVAILVLAAGSYMPLTRRVSFAQGAWLTASSWTAVLTGSYFVLKRGIGSPLPKVIATATLAPLLPTLYATLPRPAFARLTAALGLYGIGLWMYQTKKPTLLPHHFGYHELFHLVISCAGFLTVQLHEQ